MQRFNDRTDMDPKRSRLRYSATLALALAGLGTAAGVLLYHAEPARAQEQQEPTDEELNNERNALPDPETLEDIVRQREEEMAEPTNEADREPAPTTAAAPSTEPTTLHAPEEPAEPARRGDRLRGTRLDSRRRGTSTTQPTNAATQPTGANAAVAAHDAAPSTQPGATVIKPNGHPGGIVLNFQDASTDAVLEELSAAAGFIVVKEVTPISGRVTLMSKQPVTPDEAVSLLNTVLKKNGYAAVRQGRVLKVMDLAKARKSAIPVHSGRDAEKIEPTDELITQVIPIGNADATQLKEDLAPLINTEQADFSANASSNSLIITDTAANIRRIVEVVTALDTGIANSVDFRAFKLKYASAANAAKLITEIFGQQQQSGQSSSPSPFPFFGGFGRSDRDRGERGDRGSSRSGGSGASATDARRAGRVTASSDDRTNTVVVTAPTELLEDIAKIVTQLDSDPTEEQSVFVHSLRNAQSAQLEAVINSLFNGGGSVGSSASRNQTGGLSSLSGNSSTGFGGSRSGGSSFGSGGRSSSSGFGSSGGLGSSGFGNSGFGSSGFGSSRSSSGFGGYGSSISSGAARAASDLAGQVTVVADQDTNSLLVMTSPTNFDRVKKIIEELDRPVPQVLIKVLIAEVTHDNSLDVGSEFSILNLRASGFGPRVGTDFGVAGATGGLVARVVENDVSVTLRALERQGKLDVLSRPYILGSDNQLASISVGQEVPIPESTRVLDDGSSYTPVSYEKVGILLSVIPHINPDGLVIMDVQPTISALTGSSIQINENFNAPIFNSRSAQSRVAIQNGKTIVIGGLMEDRKGETLRKIPILGDIPVLGAAFRRLEQTKTKTELLIFLTPHVASSPEVLSGMTTDELGGTKLLPQAVEPGTYESHREGLERGATEVVPRGGARDMSPTTRISPATQPTE